ncbi:effector-associated domain EAD1-containing protein [Streptomyces prunicolor]|uniref:Effector-associated domain EAD1-containing protein n=1 Tax=Streptomyces prunicolor TaxID=67348 RepID=A0ABU4F3P9_9ACTN|nr:effector-associated domain EAD1-containing protein [Streptomyces prunicolor]MDV7215224.1 effector-associated domain EAD1-containing protein [Streptomyces prunicolor]
MTDGDEFTRTEITELAKIFPPIRPARSLLRDAGFPVTAIPATPDTALGFWEQVAESVADGLMEDGRRKILAEALDRYHTNPVFRGASTKPRKGTRLRVLVMGASPRGNDRIRWDRELRAITDANRGHLDLESCPAASVLDLNRIRNFKPDLLHLACHGEGDHLVFEDVDGERHQVAAADVVDTLRLAWQLKGVRLRGVLLRSCNSQHIAGLFTEVADTVVAHEGALDDVCATVFADRFYRELADDPDLRTAARLAARDTANFDQSCRSLLTGLVILPDPPRPN